MAFRIIYKKFDHEKVQKFNLKLIAKNLRNSTLINQMQHERAAHRLV
jgi:hypothetical protein